MSANRILDTRHDGDLSRELKALTYSHTARVVTCQNKPSLTLAAQIAVQRAVGAVAGTLNTLFQLIVLGRAESAAGDTQSSRRVEVPAILTDCASVSILADQTPICTRLALKLRGVKERSLRTLVQASSL